MNRFFIGRSTAFGGYGTASVSFADSSLKEGALITGCRVEHI